MKLVSVGEDRRSLPIFDLIRACVESGDLAAWEEFVARVHPLIAVTVLRTARRYGGVPTTVIEDLIQETYVKICANDCKVLHDFHAGAQEAIFGLVKSIACNVVHDHLRSMHAVKRGAGQPEATIEDAERVVHSGSSAGQMSPVERQVFIQQVEDRLCQIETQPTERRVFWLYYRHGMTTRAIAAIPGIGLTQKGVESAVHRLTVRVREWLADGPAANPGEAAKGKAFGMPF